MALVKCFECGKRISTTAKACPNCGAEPPKLDAANGAQVTKKKRRRIWPWILGAIVLFFVYAANHKPTQEEREARAQREAHAAAQSAADDERTHEVIWVERGKDAVKARLKDPDSAEFKDVTFARGKDNLPVTCGQVNSKNGFGGYTGFQHFVSAGSPDSTFLEGEVKDFRKSWNRYCVTK